MKWTYEICKEEALKYNTRKELQLNNPSIYAKIKGSKWFELYNHMKTKNNWSYEECKTEALKYNNRKELQKNSSTFYSKIKDNKWFELYNHMETTNIWTYEKCREEALKYNTRKEMGIENKLLYCAIRKNKWYELCDHMEVMGNLYKRLIYVYEFQDKSCYVGLTCNLDIRNKQHRKTNGHRMPTVCEHIKKTGLEPILVKKTDYIAVNKASLMEGKILEEYKNNGWKILNKVKTGNIGGSKLKWTYEKCKDEALKYINISDLTKNNALYCALNKYGWLEELTMHVKRNKVKNIYKTKEECYIEAIKCKNRKEFYKKNRNAYDTSYKNGWLDDFFEKTIINAKSVIKYDIDMNEICKYYSIKEASDYSNINTKSISNVCKGIKKSVKGYIFKFS